MGRRSPSLEEWRGAVSSDLGHLKEKLDEGFERMEQALAEHAALDQKVQTGLTERLTTVEKKHANLLGRLTAYGAVLIVALQLAAKLLFG